MLNHFYCLLLNQLPPENDTTPWRRLMGSFKPIQLPSHLEYTRQLLVPTAAWLNQTYAAEEILSVLFDQRYEDYNSQPDSRVSSVYMKPVAFAFPSNIVALNTEANQCKTSPTVVISRAEEEFSNLEFPIQRKWTLKLLDADTVQISYGTKVTTADPKVSIPLAKDCICFLSLEGAILGAEWSIEVYKQPVNSLYRAYDRINNANKEKLASLFEVTQDQDDALLSTYLRWYRDRRTEADRLAGVAFAYILKATALLPNSQQGN